MSGVLHGVLASLAGRVKDAFFYYVTLLLNTTSTNGAQNNTFLDSSTNNFTITRNGDTTQGSFTPYMPNGYWGAYFDGTGDYLDAPNNSAFDLAAGNFTLEAWVNTTRTVDSWVFGYYVNNPTLTTNVAYNAVVFGGAWIFSLASSSTQTDFSIGSTASVSNNAWHHIALVRSGNTVSAYLDGVRTSTATYTSTLNNPASAVFRVGGNTGTFEDPYAGYVSNLRLVKGTAVYDPTLTTLTVPTAPLTAITNTSLLTCQSNRFIDNSSNTFAITRNGDTRISKFSPFNPTASWDAATYGGSGYFDGNGDYLSAPAGTAWAFGTGDFTVEAWVYFAPGSLAGRITNRLPSTGAAGTWSFNFSPTAFSFTEVITGEPGVTATGLPVMASAWTHLVACRSGTTLRLFANGVQVGSGTNSTNFSNTSYALEIGRTGSLAGETIITGYISNLRVVKGTAVYTSNFTPPTAPLTAITNTSLLLNFTNAGIYDASTINDAQTVGNAQVSTTVAKFGATSMAFDGTGDWLTVIDKPELRFGTGAFTIEGWVYLGATGAARGIVAKGTATTGWLLSTDATNKVVFTFTTSTITSTGALSGSTWYHIAVVREGTGSNQTKIYIDGVNDGTGTVSTDFNQTSILYVGANRTGGDALNGYIDELRITNGYARYTTNFTPPTAAFPTQ